MCVVIKIGRHSSGEVCISFRGWCHGRQPGPCAKGSWDTSVKDGYATTATMFMNRVPRSKWQTPAVYWLGLWLVNRLKNFLRISDYCWPQNFITRISVNKEGSKKKPWWALNTGTTCMFLSKSFNLFS